jgi:hypothetical protein
LQDIQEPDETNAHGEARKSRRPSSGSFEPRYIQTTAALVELTEPRSAEDASDVNKLPQSLATRRGAGKTVLACDMVTLMPWANGHSA